MTDDVDIRRFLWIGGSSSAHKLPNPAPTVVACVLIALCAFATAAQSGRRLPKAPGRAPEVTSEPKPVEKKSTEERPKVGLILGINGHDAFANVPLYFYDSILQSCADRLRDAPSIKLDASGRNMNRTEAIRLAKSQKDAFVALLEVTTEGVGLARTPSSNYDELNINYSVFAAQTGKMVTSGRVYQSVYKNRGIITRPTGRTSSVYVEQLLKQAAREAAERILAALHVVLPRGILP